jgi:hypothetical protein
MVRNTRQGSAPSIAGGLLQPSVHRFDRDRIGRTSSGNAMMPQASAKRFTQTQ